VFEIKAYFDPDHEPKWPRTYVIYDVTHKKSATQNQKYFFYCKVEDLPSILRV